MNERRIIPCIFLHNKKAVKSFSDDTVLDENPVHLAGYYNENHCDALIVYDLSDGDAAHEESLDIIKEICENLEIPVIGAGNVKRMEDVKKLLYAGCSQAVLNYSKEENVAITEEVSKKFGKDKIVVCIHDMIEISNYKDVIEEYADRIILLNPKDIKEALQTSPVPVIATLPEMTLDKLIALLKLDNVYGITGDIVTENAVEFDALKTIFEENGISTMQTHAAFSFDDFKLNSDGLIPVVVQDCKTDEVLMVAYMNKEAYEMTIKTGRMTYFSRSRQKLWIKGETSGHYQYVKSLTIDCDYDTILAKVTQIGAACHTGNKTCFFQNISENETKTEDNPLHVFKDVYNVILDRKEHPKEGSYTNYLFDKGIDKILKKLGEEATEIVIAAKNPNPNEVKYEISDFLYHMMVLMAEKNISWEEITEDLAKR
ncbi:MAG: bifunctional phosphoribosyl-AMP cyclohydrolase/phosphoribosyl-ATP diphosphatase HisIE [Lachnospiraceae bacterium]|nr:bifunctional phosphoribosyl-AMP cyclohydrolase/phosphoribosyl-ATP diphosphatase HisIE [Lachnospiraceae bacterium]